MEKAEHNPLPFEKDTDLLLEMTEGIIDQIIEQAPPQPENPLISKEQLKLRQKQELQQVFDVRKVQARIQKAWALLKNRNVSLLDPSQHTAREAFANQAHRQLQGNTEDEQHPYHTFEEILCVPKEKIDEAYAVGKELFDKKYYSDACDVFFLLTQLNPYFANIWVAMGLCWHNLQEYDSALGNYAIAILLNEKNPEPYLYSIECYLLQKNIAHAKETIDLVTPIIEQSANKVEFNLILLNLKSHIK